MHNGGGGFILGGAGSFGSAQQRRRRTTATTTTTANATAANDGSNIDDQNNNDPLLRNHRQSQQQQQQQSPSQSQQQSQGGTDDLLLNRQETKELDEEDDDLLYDEDIDDDDVESDGGSRSRSSGSSESGGSTTSGSSSANSVNKSLMELRIKCSCFEDAVIAVPKQSTIAEVKRAVVIALGEKAAGGRYLRLIARGRLLAPDASQLADFEFVNDRDVIHAVLAAEGQRGGPQAALQRGLLSHHHHSSAGGASSSTTATSGSTTATATMGMSRRAFRRGTGINAAGVAVRDVADPNGVDYDDDEEDLLDDMLNRGSGSGSGDGNDIESGNSSSLLGFDRLRRNGLGRQEITALRVYFNRHVDRWIRQYPVAAERAAAGETDLVRRRLLQEDAWMSTQGPASELRLNLNLSSFTTATTNPSATTAWAQAQQQAQQQQLLLGGGGGGRGSVAASEAVWRAGGMSAAVGTDRDFMWGFMLGFFVGFLMLVWVWMPTVPHKQKLGILTGISFQLALGMIKGSADDQNGTDDVLGE